MFKALVIMCFMHPTGAWQCLKFQSKPTFVSKKICLAKSAPSVVKLAIAFKARGALSVRVQAFKCYRTMEGMI